MDIMSYVRPELLVVAVVLYFLGMWLKQAALSESLYVESMWYQWQHLPQRRISCRQSLQQLHREYWSQD